MKKIDLLRNELLKINFLEGVVELPKDRIPGTSFFPCGTGLYENDISEKSILVLGQDQDNEKGFELSLKKGVENYSSTWKNMEDIFNKADINLRDCFFSNCIMGLRMNSKSNVGKSPGLLNEQFLRQNLNFLEQQLMILKPKSIILLGLIPLKILSLLSDDLKYKLAFVQSYDELDSNNLGFLENVQIGNLPKMRIGTIVHPSYRKLNCINRRFLNLKGEDAEIEILRRLNGPEHCKL